MTRSIRATAACVGVAVLAATVGLAGAGSSAAAGVRPVARPLVGDAAVTTVPKGFKANSITWVSPTQGWVLGDAACGNKTCSYVIGTTDGGKKWGLRGTVNSPIAKMGLSQNPGITEIRFATPSVGWAFAAYLFHTTDGGSSWAPEPIPGHGHQVLDVATTAAGAYAVVSDCKWVSFCSKPLSLWRTATLTGSSWTRIPLKLPASPAADVAVYGETVYVVDPPSGGAGPFKNLLYASTDGGVHFSTRPVPCDSAMFISLIQVVATSATDVDLLCDGNPGTSDAYKSVYRSTNTGKTDSFAGQLGAAGYQSELAASPSGNLAVESWSDGSFIYINDTHKTTWSLLIAKSDGGAGWNDIVYVSNEQAWVVYAPAEFPSDLGQLYVTYDAGHHWSQASL